MATSGSCMIKTKLTVFAGTLIQSSFGEIGFGSDCVNLAGISPPSANAGVVSVSPGRAGGGGAFWSCATANAAKIVSASVIRMVPSSITSTSILDVLQLHHHIVRVTEVQLLHTVAIPDGRLDPVFFE